MDYNQKQQLTNGVGSDVSTQGAAESSPDNFTFVAGINTSGTDTILLAGGSSANGFQIQGASGVSITNIGSFGQSLTVLSGPSIQDGKLLVTSNGQVLGATAVLSNDSFSETTVTNGLVRYGDGTRENPYTLGITDCRTGQILQSNGASWQCASLPTSQATVARHFPSLLAPAHRS